MRDAILLEATDLDRDESKYCKCPVCGRKDKMSVTRLDLGVVYHCFRDACDTAGFIEVEGRVSKKGAKQANKRKGTGPYIHATRKLSAAERVRFQLKGISNGQIKSGGFLWAPRHAAYVFPVRDYRGWDRGCILRWYDGRPDKAKSFKVDAAAPWLAWYPSPDQDLSRVLLVEDQVSALKAQPYVTAVALLGTALSELEASELAAVGAKEVIVALDADATATARKLARKYRLLFHNISVMRLTKDVKDMRNRHIKEMLGG